MSRFRWLWVLVLPMLALACLRLWVSWPIEAPQTIDELAYLSVAQYLATGDGLIEHRGRPAYKVGWSLVLAPFLAIDSGPYASFRAAQLANCLILCLYYLLAWLLVGRLADLPDGERVLISLCVSAYPSLTLYSATGLAESLFATTFLCLVVLAERLLTSERPPVALSFATGLVAGFLYIIHERGFVAVFAFLMVLTLASLFNFRARRRNSILTLSFSWLGAALVIGVSELLVEIPGSEYLRTVEFQRVAKATLLTPGYLIRALMAQAWYLLTATGGVLLLAPIWGARLGCRTASSLWENSIGKQAWWWFLKLSLLGTVLLTVVHMSRLREPTLEAMIYGRYVEGVLGPVLLVALLAMRRWQRRNIDSIPRAQALLRQLAVLAVIAAATIVLARFLEPSQGRLLSFNSAGAALLVSSKMKSSIVGSSAIAVLISVLVATIFRINFRLGVFGLLVFFVASALRIAAFLQPHADDLAESHQLAFAVRRLSEPPISTGAASRTSKVVIKQDPNQTYRAPFYFYNAEYWLPEFDFVRQDPTSPFLLATGLEAERSSGSRLTAIENIKPQLSTAPLGLWVRPGVVQERAAEWGLLFPKAFPNRYGPEELAASAELLTPSTFPRTLKSGSILHLKLAVTHQGSAPWPSEKALGGQLFSVRFDVTFRRENQAGANRRIQLPLARTYYRTESFELPMKIQAPIASGEYIFEVRIFQETGGNNPVATLSAVPILVETR